MKRFLHIIALLICSSIALAANNIPVIPIPAEVVKTEGHFRIESPLTVSPADKASKELAKSFATDMSRLSVSAKSRSKGGAVKVVIDKSLADEGYRLDIAPEGITVEASSANGAFYAAQTLAQLKSAAGPEGIGACRITDRPRMAYRGLMLDVVRHFTPVEELKRFIDVASRLKINNLHLHLTDDNGWRMQIDRYPRLTEVGAWRVDRKELFPGRLNQRSADEPTPIGGFYTKDEMRDLVKYAAERHVNIIPEIEMPAHAAAAIASYPELACPVNEKFVGVFPGIGGRDASIIMCAGNDKVLEFYRNVLDEVMDVFPSPLINLGGDEADKRLWRECPLCQKRIVDEGLRDCEHLQAWFMDSISSYVNSHGCTAMGWDEVTYGNPASDMVILGWQGDGHIAVDDSRRSGRKFIMTPALVTYLIRYQGPQWFEPWTYFGNNTLRDIYFYEPVKADWTPELEENLLGIQGSLWTEFCNTESDMEYQVFPRLLAVAERGWAPKGSANWEGFLKRVDSFLPTLDSLDITYARSMYNIQHTARPDSAGGVTVMLECERPDLELRYSLTDSASMVRPYTAPLRFTGPATVYAATFADGVQKGRTLTLPINFNLATGRAVTAKSCRNGLQAVLTNGVRGSDRNSDFEWAGWHSADAEFTVDLGRPVKISGVDLGTLINSDICVAAPTAIRLYTSADGETYTLAAESVTPDSLIYAHPARIVDFSLVPAAPAEARYVKITATNPGPIPAGMAREYTPTWLYFDEITVR